MIISPKSSTNHRPVRFDCSGVGLYEEEVRGGSETRFPGGGVSVSRTRRSLSELYRCPEGKNF